MKKIYYLLAAALMMGLSACHRQKEPVLETEQYSLSDVCYLQEEHTDSLNITVDIEIPTKMDNEDLLTIVQMSLIDELLGEAYAELPIEEAIESYAAMLKGEYILSNADMAEEWHSADWGVEEGESSNMFCQEEYLNGTVMGIHRGVLSYGIERYVYAGGPHGQNTRMFLNFNLKDGELIGEEELFGEGYEEPLTELMLKCFVEQNDEIGSIEAIEEAGYMIEDIRPNGNFYLADDGMVYVFNPYDIAPYAFGESVIVLPWSELNELFPTEEEK